MIVDYTAKQQHFKKRKIKNAKSTFCCYGLQIRNSGCLWKILICYCKLPQPLGSLPSGTYLFASGKYHHTFVYYIYKTVMPLSWFKLLYL
jgi:hypothetical protein